MIKLRKNHKGGVLVPENVITRLEILQENLCDLRKIAGWTAQTLAKNLNVTKQTVHDLETQKVNLSQTQCIALNIALACEVMEKPENITLRRTIDILSLIDSRDYLATREQLRAAMTAVASLAESGISGQQLFFRAKVCFTPLGGACAFVYARPLEKAPLKWENRLYNSNQG